MPDFETKDSGDRAVYDTGMVRDTNVGKARFDLLFPRDIPYREQLLTRFADLMARGAVKYDARNWEKARTAEELDRYKESAARHFVQWMTGETDEDHAAAVMFNLMGAEYVRSRMAMPDSELGDEHVPNYVVVELDNRPAGPGWPGAMGVYYRDIDEIAPFGERANAQRACDKLNSGADLEFQTIPATDYEREQAS